MRIFKRNQLIILVISLMLITAGYLNFTTNDGNIDNNKIIPTSETVAELGDATLVSGTLSLEEQDSEENKNEDNIGDEIETSKMNDDDSYFTSSKLERENMYSQMLETYQEIYNNVNSTAEQKKEAINEISKINNIKNGIMISENLISAKGFENVIIFVNSNSVSVIVGEDEISSEQIAQIQNIVSRELDVNVDIINISIK